MDISDPNTLRGKKLRCPITGVEGICTSISDQLSGTLQAAITPKGDGTEVKDGHYIDVNLLEIVDDGVSAKCSPPDPKVVVHLGDKVEDTITGYIGVVTDKVTFINGCVYFGVQGGLDKEGKRLEALFAVHKRLKVLKPEPEPKLAEVKTQRTGGPMRKALSQR